MIDYSNSAKVERLTPCNGQYFFGYYDITPESPDGKRVLVNHAPFIDRMPTANDLLEVGYINIGEEEFHPIGTTTAWNFQEGCRLQWLSNDKVIFNCRTNDGFGSIVYDIAQNGIVQRYSLPIYSISKTKQTATSYGFINNKYNYAHSIDDEKDDKYGKGVYLVDLKSGESSLLVNIDELMGLVNSSNYKNWVEYCTFNPNGDSFFIYHRWENEKGLAGNNLCVCDLNGNIRSLLVSKFISHAGWKGNNEISSWCRLPSSINSIQGNSIIGGTALFDVMKKIYHIVVKKPSLRQKFTNDAYVIFDVKNNTNRKISNREFTSDGHCTWSLNCKFMLTDTYPNEDKKRQLMLYNFDSDKIYLLGEFYSYPKGMESLNPIWNASSLRCDLHPKWGNDNRYIYFDSVHEGYRGLYRVNVSDIMGGKN
jgi:hypothetical protein